jgi:hypothetical protein
MRWMILFLFSFVFLEAEIIEIKKIDECLEHAKPEMLILFDIDNTLMETTQTLGSDQWFSHRIEEYVNQGFSKEEALLVTRFEWVSIQYKSNVQPVEPTTAQLIQKLQKNGWKVLALTTRGLYLANRTIEQLQSIGINLAIPAFPHEMTFNEERGAMYRDGILFSAGTDKGPLLFQFLEKVHLQPKKILFVDDRKGHLQNVEAFCNQHQIPFLGLRYGFLDEKVHQLRSDLAQVQLARFGQLISDEEAESVLKSGGCHR